MPKNDINIKVQSLSPSLSLNSPLTVPYQSLTCSLPVPYFYTIELDLIEIRLLSLPFEFLLRFDLILYERWSFNKKKITLT